MNFFCARFLAVAAIACAGAKAQGVASVRGGNATDQSSGQWEAYLSTMALFAPDGSSLVTPDLAVSRGRLHLHARYNWEDLRTGSFFIGGNYSFDKGIHVDVSPLIGGVFGRTSGIAPACLLSVSYWRLSLDTQSEYVFSLNEADSFLNVWSELSVGLTDRFRAGVMSQRNKAVRQKVENQYGVLFNASFGRLDVTAYVFDLGRSNPSGAVALGVRF